MCEAADGGLGSFPVHPCAMSCCQLASFAHSCTIVGTAARGAQQFSLAFPYECSVWVQNIKNFIIYHNFIYRDLKCSLCMSILILFADACPSQHGTEIQLQHSAMSKNSTLPKLPC